IRGLIAVPQISGDPCYPARNAVVENLHTGEQHTILQNRGQNTRGCRLNPAILAQAGNELRQALETNPDLVVVNRFGSSEAEGGGFRAEILSLVTADIPVLLVVTDRYLDAWRQFIGSAE